MSCMIKSALLAQQVSVSPRTEERSKEKGAAVATIHATGAGATEARIALGVWEGETYAS